ncbi:MAG: sugar ABC transporter permease [Eubacterium sp.]
MEKFLRGLNKFIVYVVLTLIALTVIYPLVYVVAGAFSPGEDIGSVTIIPFQNGFTFEHFGELLEEDYWLWFKNTLIIAVCTSALTIVVASLAAYVFSRFKFTFKKSMMMALLVLQIFPSFIGMIALYVILHRIGGLDTLWGMILIYVAGNIPYNTWMVKSYLDTIPKSLDEAAKIDGASNARIFGTIVFPLAKPIIVFLGITTFTAPWMDFIFPKFVLRSDEKKTLAVGLYGWVSDKKDKFTLFAAGSLIVTIPFIIFFMLTQNMLVTSLAGAAVKE